MNTTKSTHDIANHNLDVFPEFAISLFYFIQKLHSKLVLQGHKHVYFLSREGQPLKEMFDLYNEKQDQPIESHYLEVSRRSTLLPSLSAIENESFETLFRQYRRISLFEFLSSLGLQVHIKNIALELGLPEGREAVREEDFPTSETFSKLMSLPLFLQLYESERRARRSAFIEYLADLADGETPTNLVIVDVGWKGTIQDNLFTMLCNKDDTPVKNITGYYIGLVAPGAASQHNEKHGLLFSLVGEPSAKCRVFQENTALFEVLLAADHGSTVSYEKNANGRAHPIRGEFEEREMLENKVFPVKKNYLRRFKKLVDSINLTDSDGELDFSNVVKAHARMVFNANAAERTWFSSIFHVENFGVFERSNFNTPEKRPGLIQRYHFLKDLLLKKRGQLGFWPWLKIFTLGGYLPATMYATIRRLQK